MRSRIWLAALPLMMTPLAAQAAAADFAACDGYAAPKKKSDGITKGTWLWGLASTNADFRRGTVFVGARGIAACDAALADPLLVDAFWVRRAHLLQSKALHQMSDNAFKEALATLDQSDAIGAAHADPQFNNSIKLANLALRAIAYYRLERKEDARAALKAVTDARPWSVSLRQMTTAIRTTYEGDYETQKAVLHDQARIDPRKLHVLFWLAMSRGEFEEAAADAHELSFDIPRSRHDWATESAEVRAYALIRERASVAGATAYALAATGKVEASAHEYQRGLDEIEDATQPPPPDERGRPPGKQAMRDYDLRKASGVEAQNMLRDWGRAIALRREASGMTVGELLALKDRPTGEALMVAADFFAQVKATDFKQADGLNQVIDMLRKRQEEFRQKALTISFNQLVKQLPRPETAQMVPKMQREGGNILRSNLNGWAVRKADDPALVNVRFGDAVGSSALVEEAAFLAAANHVASLGKDGFIIEASQLIVRTTQVSGMYIGSYSTPSGYELRLLLRPVDTAAPSADIESSRWRIVKVRDVQAALNGKFPPGF